MLREQRGVEEVEDGEGDTDEKKEIVFMSLSQEHQLSGICLQSLVNVESMLAAVAL